MTPPRPRVLLVDDDASIRRFVELALDGLDIEFLSCASVAEAVAALQQGGPARLVITDLMMPGEGGVALLRRLHDEPALRGNARLAVFSAGLVGVANAARAQLAPFDIWRLLPKPVPLQELEDCVLQALEQAAPAAPPPAAAAAPVSAALSEQELLAVQTHFAGEQALFIAFREGCRVQFARDVADGDAALARGDTGALHRLAHSLKSVLSTLGHPALSERARQLEYAAAAGAAAGPLAPGWQALRSGLLALTLSVSG